MIALRRLYIEKDLDFIFKVFSNYDEQILIARRIDIKSFEDFRDWFIFQLKHHYHEFRIIEENNNVVGFCYSYDYVDGNIKTVLHIIRERQNSGIGAMSEILFLDELFKIYPIRKVYNHIYSYNEQSLNSHISAGFEEEGKLKEYRYFNGEYHDIYIMAITREMFYKQCGQILYKKRSNDKNAKLKFSEQ